MKAQHFFAMIVAATVLFTACSKDDSNTPDSPVKNSSDFIASAGPQKQSFTLNTSELPKTISLKGGIKITIPANAFKKGGVPVTGTITVEAIELLKKSQLVLSTVNTMHVSGQLLKSDGSFFLDVKVNGQSVDNKLEVPINVQVPATRDGGTQLWVGDTLANNQFAWNAPAQGAQRDVKAVDQNFIFDFGQLGWVNCDIFWNASATKTTVKVSIPNNPGTMASFRAMQGETFVFFISKGLNDRVVAQIYTPSTTNEVKSYDNSMPIGAQGRLISFSVKDGRFWFAKKDITITENLAESLTLQETTQEAVQAEITALDNL